MPSSVFSRLPNDGVISASKFGLLVDKKEYPSNSGNEGAKGGVNE